MKLFELVISKGRRSVNYVAIVNIHDKVNAAAVGKEFAKIARVIFRLRELLHIYELLDKRAIPNSPSISLAIQRGFKPPNDGNSIDGGA